MNYIYSTMTNSVRYAFYVPNPNGDLPKIQKDILVKGGANVATEKNGTPMGVITEINDEDLKHLESHWLFKFHREKGFIIVDKHKKDVEKAVADMEKRDEASPLVPQDYEFAPENTAKPEGIKSKKNRRNELDV